MIVVYEVSKSTGRIARREYTRETATRYYYPDSFSRLGKETWTKKEDFYSRSFTNFEDAKTCAIERAAANVTSARAHLAIAEEAYDKALKATEDSVK